MSYSIVLNGNSSILSSDFFPIDVSKGEWEIGVIDFNTYNSIPNITEGENNVLTVGETEITFPTGAYEIEDIERYIISKLPAGVAFGLKPNVNTLQAEIKCTEKVDFSAKTSIAPLLGFNNVVLAANKKHVSEFSVNIIKVNVIRIECNIAVGSYVDGVESHILHEFFPSVPPGYKIIEIPTNVIYLPVNVNSVHNITISLRDQFGRTIDFRKETVTVRLHLRRRNNGASI